MCFCLEISVRLDLEDKQAPEFHDVYYTLSGFTIQPCDSFVIMRMIRLQLSSEPNPLTVSVCKTGVLLSYAYQELAKDIWEKISQD